MVTTRTRLRSDAVRPVIRRRQSNNVESQSIHITVITVLHWTGLYNQVKDRGKGSWLDVAPLVAKLSEVGICSLCKITNSKKYNTGCAAAQHCYNGDVRLLYENLEIWPPVKFKHLSRLSQNLSQLITSMRRTLFPSLVKIRSRGTSGQIGEMSLSCDILIFFSEARAETDFDAWCLKMRAITQGCAFLGLKY